MLRCFNVCLIYRGNLILLSQHHGVYTNYVLKLTFNIQHIGFVFFQITKLLTETAKCRKKD